MRTWAQENGHTVIREYVEAGASATDDRRPVFQEMISDSKIRPRIFDFIVVHSFSHFFRDEIDFGLHRRDLEKLGIEILSITQPIQNGPGEDLMRSILTAYVGTYYSNLRNGKTKQPNPVSEWIPVEIPPIVDALLFEQVKVKREERSPAKIPPRVVTSPSLLTGLLKCSCGASMTITTGKSGRYKYYKCTSKNSRGSKSCNSTNIPVKKMDALVMNEMIERVLEPSHLKGLIKAIISEMRETGDTGKKRMQELNNAIKGIEKHQ